MHPAVVLYEYAMQLVGKPYIWGGDDPIKGFDCSGLVLELLQAAGVWHGGDATAMQIANTFKDSVVTDPTFGSLVFFGTGLAEISHIGFCLNTLQMLEAGGGDHTCVNADIAAVKNAFVKVRPISRRKDVVGYRHPPYAWKV